MEALAVRWPLHAVTVSTHTPTGAATLQDQWGGRVQHLYAPVDTPGACARFLDRLQPRLVVLVERELWPELLLQCRARAIPVVLVNARLSERSARATSAGARSCIRSGRNSPWSARPISPP
jgi:3-deoxy-D-manno-octulosonic-acid transferase